MRLSLWLILIFAFSVGMGCALVIRTLYFEAKPAVAQESDPQTKILVAKRTIPRGAEITAELLAFQEVSLSEVPLGALANFAQVYRHRSAYTIPAECPICEDLLLPHSDDAAQGAFIPTGSQFVTLAVDHIRQGDKVFTPTKPLSTMLAADQRIDIQVVPRVKTQGRLTEMKNEVLRSRTAPDFKNDGELVLENVPIHQIQRRSVANQVGSIRDSFVLLLNKNDETKLATAAKKGQIRIALHRNEETAQQPAEVIALADIAERTLPPDTVQEVPDVLEQPPMPKELPLTDSSENAVKDAPEPADTIDAMLSFAPMPAPAPNFMPFPAVRESRILDTLGNSPMAKSPPDDERTSIRNDAPVNSFVGLPTRVTHAIQFVSPGSVAPAQELARQTETDIKPLTAPSAVSVPPLLLEKTRVPEYSPFEQRRVYTVKPDGNLFKESSDSDLPTPPRLLKNSNVSTPTE